jgi:hypothetical protein
VLGPSTALAVWQDISPDPEMQVDPVAPELDLILILGRAAEWCPEQHCCFNDRGCDVVESDPGKALRDCRTVTSRDQHATVVLRDGCSVVDAIALTGPSASIQIPLSPPADVQEVASDWRGILDSRESPTEERWRLESS